MNNGLEGILKEIIKEAIKETLGETFIGPIPKQHSSEEKVTLNIPEVATYMGIAEDKVRQLVHTKDFPCFKNGNKWCVNREMLDEWLEKISTEHRQI